MRLDANLQPTCNQLATDCVSRQAAIDAALTFVVEYCGAAFDEDMQKMLCERLDALPSAQPEQHWIPCSEKDHPDLPIRVQVQMNNGWIITAYYQDGDWLSVPNYGDVIRDEWIEAWRELPEPYREEGDDC